ncbi:type II toxin-antitoxin system ParD family antitoxin [Muricoccus pecuniae]|uniref:type II toxin-antitoxin system ParD family antitoxin n=1 Tax=Muricoccus pecuniae TaxID=693023 RepID=UPI001622FB4F|nr:type II toxin-antitoxin system ParD family antitoxin [Roseomonas pecuniae]
MPARHTLHVALTAELCDFVSRLVASGRYQSSSEVVRAGLRLLERSDGRPILSHGTDVPRLCTRELDEQAAG